MTGCPRSGCGGTFDEDGFCDTCGMTAPASAPAASAPTPAPAEPVDTDRTARTAPSGSMAGSRRGSSRSSNRGLLGAGLVEVPRVPYRDPRTAILTDPRVPESARFCSACGAQVGRGRDGRPGRTEGFCTSCRTRFSFSPKLAPGQLVHGQYEVLGCLAHGGLGWVYLALDRAVADRWVVLKGLLDTGDADATAAAVAERRFLAEVEHPNIVKIHNFVEHPDPDGAAVGYIVMEYVGGQSVKDMLKELRATDGPDACLPVPRGIAYALEMLPALGHLHAHDLVFCDFKPDNMIQTEEQLKLIDLGAMRRLDDEDGAIFGTVGYQAPEIAEDGPSVASDLYTVGRALAVMTLPFDFQRTFVDRLPDPADQPPLARYDSYHRFLLRATARRPEARFGSAQEMRDQLTGVLREVLAADDGVARPGVSTEFTPERRSFGVSATLDPPTAATIAGALPVPQADAADPSAAFLATITAIAPAMVAEQLKNAPQDSPEVRLRLVRAHLEAGETGPAGTLLDTLASDRRLDRRWTVDWYRGVAGLIDGDLTAAARRFDAVYSALPGEAAPKLALAVCAELSGDAAAADRGHRAVWRTDRSYDSAAFGAARTAAARGDRRSACDVLCTVPETSRHHVTASLAAATVLVVGDEPRLDELVAAGDLVTGLGADVDTRRAASVSARVLEAALGWTAAGHDAGDSRVLGCRMTEPDLRVALEDCYRVLARHASTAVERIVLVDRANRIRPRTWV